MHKMVKMYYDELRMRMNYRVRQEANGQGRLNSGPSRDDTKADPGESTLDTHSVNRCRSTIGLGNLGFALSASQLFTAN